MFWSRAAPRASACEVSVNLAFAYPVKEPGLLPAQTFAQAASGPAGGLNSPLRLESATYELLSGDRKLMQADNDARPLEFNAVVAEHGPYIWRVLRRLGVRASDIEDVWQETFIVVHRKLGGFEG